MEQTMYERIKVMTMEEMKAFVYWVYRNDVIDGEMLSWDDESGYFGGYFLTLDAEDVIASMGSAFKDSSN